MQTTTKKVKLIYLPFLAITAAFIVVYTFLNWLFFIRANTFPIREDFPNIWLPMILPWIPILIWLKPRLELLNLRAINAHLPFLYLYITSLAMAIPTIIAQTYIEKASATLTKLETVDQINTGENPKYCTLKEFELDKKSTGVFSLIITKRNEGYILMRSYYVVPIIESVADTAKSKCPGWIAIKYSKRLYGKVDSEARKYQSFLAESKEDFDKKDLKSFRYLERSKINVDYLGFKKAIKKSGKPLSKESPVFLASYQPFEKQTGDILAWLIVSFAIGNGIWLILLAIPKLAPDGESYLPDNPEPVLEAGEKISIRNYPIEVTMVRQK